MSWEKYLHILAYKQIFKSGSFEKLLQFVALTKSIEIEHAWLGERQTWLTFYRYSKSSERESSCRKTRVSPQPPSEQADAQSRPRVSREMLPVHWKAWTCLSIVTLESLRSQHGPLEILNTFLLILF